MQKLNVSCPDSSHTIRKFTFKKDKPIGLFRAFEGAWTDIKLNKRVVGYITETRSHHFIIYFAILNQNRTGINSYPPKSINRRVS